MKTERADILIFKKGLAESREDAKRLIMAGKVRTAKDRIVSKPSEEIANDSEILIEHHDEYVGRGAYKLLPAIHKYPPSKKPFIAADIGASTGGFCDVLLRNGARKIYAVDSGIGQLHQKIRSRTEVISLEKTNARYISKKEIPDNLDVVSIDVSFISVKKILPAIAPLLSDEATIYVLVKPQFEADRKEIRKGGVVKDPAIIERCVREIANLAEKTFGWKTLECIPSPISGPKGNREQLLVLKKTI
ncbi:MAG TPA: TlyA family RNA methyltransferase [Victivallales bacterium]|nr:TlyA family RNA methyltransferase [Victivallales bacterium]